MFGIRTAIRAIGKVKTIVQAARVVTAARAAEMTVPVKNLFLEATVAAPAKKTNQNHQRKNQAARVEIVARAVEMIARVKNLFQEATVVVVVKVLNAQKIRKKSLTVLQKTQKILYSSHILTHIGSTIAVMEKHTVNSVLQILSGIRTAIRATGKVKTIAAARVATAARAAEMTVPAKNLLKEAKVVARNERNFVRCVDTGLD